MRYALLVYAPGDADLPATGYALFDPTTATTIRVRSGRVLLTDGPVADHHEQLRGVVVIDVQNLDEAIAVAARAPDAREGAVEIRPVRETP